jgi:hypothetical protein
VTIQLNETEEPKRQTEPLRLRRPGARPPVPRVEDEDVGGEPVAGLVDGVELEDAAGLVLHEVHKVVRQVVHHRHVVVLHTAILRCEQRARPAAWKHVM